MDYLLAIKTAVILFPILAFFITGPYILYQYHKFASIHPLKTIIIYSFVFYLLCAYFLVILPLPTIDSVMENPDWMIQPIPFHFVLDFIKETPLVLSEPITYIKTIFHPSFYVVSFNILLFVPLGMFLRYYKGYFLRKIIKVSFLLSLFFEFTQLTRLYGIYPKPYRLCDVDDLILNTFGGIVGYLLMLDLEKRIPSKEEFECLAYKKGEVVSPLRRVTLFFLDLFIYFIITIFTKGRYSFLVFLIYFTILPIFLDYKTLGSAFLNVRFKKLKNTFTYYLRPYLLYFYYLGVPYGIFAGAAFIGNYITSSTIKITFYLLVIVLVFLFYIINLVLLFIHERRFYDKLCYMELESTIKEKGHS